MLNTWIMPHMFKIISCWTHVWWLFTCSTCALLNTCKHTTHLEQMFNTCFKHMLNTTHFEHMFKTFVSNIHWTQRMSSTCGKHVSNTCWIWVVLFLCLTYVAPSLCKWFEQTDQDRDTDTHGATATILYLFGQMV